MAAAANRVTAPPRQPTVVARVVARLSEAVPEVLAAPPALAPRLWIQRIHDILEVERSLVAVFSYEVPYTRRLPAVRSIHARLFELSRAVQDRAGIELAHGAATLHLMINLVSSTILQLVLDPPDRVENEEMLGALADRIARWTDGG